MIYFRSSADRVGRAQAARVERLESSFGFVDVFRPHPHAPFQLHPVSLPSPQEPDLPRLALEIGWWRPPENSFDGECDCGRGLSEAYSSSCALYSRIVFVAFKVYTTY